MSLAFSDAPTGKPLRGALGIAFSYALIGIFWILFSDLAVSFIVRDPDYAMVINVLKGWAFVVVSAMIIAGLAYRSLAQLLDYDRNFLESCESLRSTNRELLRYRRNLDALVQERTLKLEAALAESRMKDAALEAATSEARKASNAKSTFLAHMSHEIRTPLNAIVGLTRLMEKTELSQKQADYCQMMRDSSSVLLGIINDILDFSKIESGKLELDQRPYSLRNLMDRIGNVVYPLVNDKGLNLEIDVHPSLPDRFVGDELRIGQVLINLSMNAVKFTKRGYIRIKVFPSVQGDRFMLGFQVEDSGIGISEAQMGRLFKAFSQADSSTTKEYGGTGLGLSISKVLIEAMGGSINLESREGVGTVFSFEVAHLPVADDRDAASAGASDQSIPDVAPAQISPVYLPRGGAVLLVDDNEINLMILEECLRDTGLYTRSAQGGREALDAVGEERFDIILLDLHMPEIDGIAVARAIRAKGGDPARPAIIALTADADSAVRESVLEAGMNDFVTKPIDHDGLLASLSYWFAATAGKDVPSGEGQ
jgi:two-component system sensor histidine kinase/response regulator